MRPQREGMDLLLRRHLGDLDRCAFRKVAEEVVAEQSHMHQRRVQPVEESASLVAGSAGGAVLIRREEVGTRRVEHLQIGELHLDVCVFEARIEQSRDVPCAVVSLDHHVAVPYVTVNESRRAAGVQHPWCELDGSIDETECLLRETSLDAWVAADGLEAGSNDVRPGSPDVGAVDRTKPGACVLVELAEQPGEPDRDGTAVDSRQLEIFEADTRNVLEQERRKRHVNTRLVVEQDVGRRAVCVRPQVAQRSNLVTEPSIPQSSQLHHSCVGRAIKLDPDNGVDVATVERLECCAGDRLTQPRANQSLGLGTGEFEMGLEFEHV